MSQPEICLRRHIVPGNLPTTPGEIMREFFKNLLAMCNMLQAPKPAHVKQCEFCGGGRCIGACGLIGDSGSSRDFYGRLVPCAGGEGCFACDDGTQLCFQRDSKVGRNIASACPVGMRCRITVTVDEGVITAFISAEHLETSSLAAP